MKNIASRIKRRSARILQTLRHPSADGRSILEERAFVEQGTNQAEPEKITQTTDLAKFFAIDWYLENNPDVQTLGIDPLEHYLNFGWKEGRDPTSNFSVASYLACNPDVAEFGLEPFTHYIEFGIKEGRLMRHGETAQFADYLDTGSVTSEAIVEKFFAKDWYLENNPDVRAHGKDPLEHYLNFGWKEGRDPTANFSVASYLACNPDVDKNGFEPFTHYIEYGLREGRLTEVPKWNYGRLPTGFDHARAFHSVQDQSFPLAAETAENILVIVVPEHNTMSGGIYSFFSIARTAYNLRFKHEYFVLLMTRPHKRDVTYTRQRNFRNSEDVFRFEQLQRCRAAKTVYVHIPEYAAPDFVKSLDDDMLHYLRSREQFYVNVLNQKIDIMPEREDFSDLRGIADGVSQSVAHHAYSGQKFADKYDLPTLLLPAFTDLSGYEPLEFADKEKLIIYSPDDSIWKEATLNRLREGLPDYELREIKDVTFDEYMDLATRCRFSITFGEGFDGYLAQPIHQGGIGFAVYNDEFFPSPDMLEFQNIFSSSDELEKNIVARIRHFEGSYSAYRAANRAMIELYDTLYSKEDYKRRVLRLIRRDFEHHPLHISGSAGHI